MGAGYLHRDAWTQPDYDLTNLPLMLQLNFDSFQTSEPLIIPEEVAVPRSGAPYRPQYSADEWLPGEIDMALYNNLEKGRVRPLGPAAFDDGVEMLDADTQEQECTSCQDRLSISYLIDLPCGHCLCHECFIGCFESACGDNGNFGEQSNFPPHCCPRQEIPLDEALLSPGLIKRYNEKKAEYELAPKDRVRCHNHQCSKFIPPSNHSEGQAFCQNCEFVTCSSSHTGSHP